MSIRHKIGSNVLFSLMLLSTILSMLFTSFSVSAATTESRQYLSAQWFLETNELQERVKNSVWLTLIGEQEIVGMIKVPALKVNDLFIEKSSSGPIYTTKMIDGKRKHVAQIKYDIYPAKAGEFTLPEMPMSIVEGGKNNNPITIQSKPLSIIVAQQPVASRGLIITPSLKVSQKVSDREFIAGGIISREISLTVRDLPGYLIAELPLSLTNTGADIRVVKNAAHTDAFRGAISGKRETEIQYRYSQPGHYSLPEVKVNWWDPIGGVVVQSSIDAIDIVVMPPPPLPLKQRLAVFYTQVIETIQAHKASLLLFMVFLVLLWWWRIAIMKRVNVAYMWLQDTMQTSFMVSVMLIVKVAFIRKEKLILLLEKWGKSADKSLQKHVQTMLSEMTYNSDGDIQVVRLSLLKQVCHIVWLQYYQRFTLQPLNPK